MHQIGERDFFGSWPVCMCVLECYSSAVHICRSFLGVEYGYCIGTVLMFGDVWLSHS